MAKTVKTYDAIAIDGPFEKALLKLLRVLDGDELKGSMKKWGGIATNPDRVTILQGNHPKGGWPEAYARDSVVLGHNVVIRAYGLAAEYLPGDFNWERVDERTWGGTLIDAAKRL